jgi:hypothetical protein
MGYPREMAAKKGRPKSKLKTRKVEVHNGWTHVCEYCGQEFAAKRSDAKYCPEPRLCRLHTYREKAKK